MYSAAEELDRKVSETLVDIIKKQTGGLMTTNEAKAAIHSVFCSVMGLVGPDVAELLGKVRISRSFLPKLTR